MRYSLVAMSRKHDVGRRYLYGLITTPYFGWAFGTFLGAAAGTFLPEYIKSALGIANIRHVPGHYYSAVQEVPPRAGSRAASHRR